MGCYLVRGEGHSHLSLLEKKFLKIWARSVDPNTTRQLLPSWVLSSSEKPDIMDLHCHLSKCTSVALQTNGTIALLQAWEEVAHFNQRRYDVICKLLLTCFCAWFTKKFRSTCSTLTTGMHSGNKWRSFETRTGCPSKGTYSGLQLSGEVGAGTSIY